MTLPQQVFISHSTNDDGIVKQLRQILEQYSIGTWVDSRQMRGSDALWPKVSEAIAVATAVIVVLSNQSINSPWVVRELDEALRIQEERGRDAYRVIPLMLPGIEPVLVQRYFGEDIIGIKINPSQPGFLQETMPAILIALGLAAPNDADSPQVIRDTPIAELILELSNPQEKAIEGGNRISAKAKLVFEAADEKRKMTSKSFDFESPIGPIEANDIRWYLEDYLIWPSAQFQTRAKTIEANLPRWGRAIYDALFADIARQKFLSQWQESNVAGVELRFSVLLADVLDVQTNAAEARAAGQLLSIPWELLHDERGFLFQGQKPVRVRRSLTNETPISVRNPGSPLRILLVSPRPEGTNGEHWLDPRASALPLVTAIESLGDLANLTVLPNGNFPDFVDELNRASNAKTPYDVVHFDGHGVYDPQLGLGALCFEAPADRNKLKHRNMEHIFADKLGAELQKHNIPLVFLEACETSKTEANPGASVAASLLQVGVASVVSMSHSVYVVTATKFVQAFYESLVDGCRIGAAMLAGQRALYHDQHRFVIPGIGNVDLQDWFVPVLFQDKEDPVLFKKIYTEKTENSIRERQQLQLGDLPDAPDHQFLGRDRELLWLERLLQRERYAVIQGMGGMGKTTLATELARWLVRTKRFERAAFISLEMLNSVHAILQHLGSQLTSGLSAKGLSSDEEALQEIARALQEFRTIIVFDNLESVLPLSGTTLDERMEALLQLFQDLQKASNQTRLVFTNREAMPAPFHQHHLELSTLSHTQALALVRNVLQQLHIELPDSDDANTHVAIRQLVDTVGGHPRALVLLAPFLQDGIAKTGTDIAAIMKRIEQTHRGQRELSLLASVELSLQRLSAIERQMIRPLAVFHGGFQVAVLAMVLGKKVDETRQLATVLVQTGLARQLGYGYFSMDPALAAYLGMELSEEERITFQVAWLEGVEELMGYIYRQIFKDVNMAFSLGQLELPNLLAAMNRLAEDGNSEKIVEFGISLGQLLRNLGLRELAERVAKMRETAVGQITIWSHTTYLFARHAIEEQLVAGKLLEAYQAAVVLKAKVLKAGESAYPEAGYDYAMVHWMLGHILQTKGQYQHALSEIQTARLRFETLAKAGDKAAEQMSYACYTETANCYLFLDKYDEAVQNYQLRIAGAEKLGDNRGIAVANGQLGTVFLLQEKYVAALEAYQNAKIIFEQLNEPQMVATALHQLGIVYKESGDYEKADRRYREALKIKAPLHSAALKASTLAELGNLYDIWNRHDEAIVFYQQAVDAYFLAGDVRSEGLTRSNLGNLLIKMSRLEEARNQLLLAITCKQDFGLQAEPWKTYEILCNLETVAGNSTAAVQARQRAIALFRDWRRAGAKNHSQAAKRCELVLKVIRTGTMAELQTALEKTVTDYPQDVFYSYLLAILKGSRDVDILKDERLRYQHVVELELLLEALREAGLWG